jgi:hypothetical protein
VNGGRRGLIGSKTITTGCDAQAFELAEQRLQYPLFFYPHAREGKNAKTRRVWRSATAVSEMEFRNLHVM